MDLRARQHQLAGVRGEDLAGLPDRPLHERSCRHPSIAVVSPELALLQSLRAGKVFGSSGPLLEVSLKNSAGDRAGPGEQISGVENTLSVSVQAAPWIPVDTLSVYLNGESISQQAISAGDDVTLPLRSEQDAFVVVEVSGTPDPRYSAVLPGFKPVAFSNPIRIDADGDGRWQAPGL